MEKFNAGCGRDWVKVGDNLSVAVDFGCSPSDNHHISFVCVSSRHAANIMSRHIIIFVVV